MGVGGGLMPQSPLETHSPSIKKTKKLSTKDIHIRS